ncbi:MAG: hypothetical protein HFP81_03830 [Methylococcales symbiont of Hymedesmia sp. n. MRB-2018]|nr:MAG: hypothetical protein HFP81_03830 [Methylococcales symbiont of Hymedesmia sp. n. MRB-2018]
MLSTKSRLQATIANQQAIVSLSLNPTIDLAYELKTLTHDPTNIMDDFKTCRL